MCFEKIVITTYKRLGSIRKVSKVLTKELGQCVPQYHISQILKDNGVEIKRRSPSIYDSQL